MISGATLTARTSELPRALVVALQGEIDLDNAAPVREELVALAERHAPAELVVDLGGVTYLDSAGIELLFLLTRRMTQVGRGLAAVVPPDAPAARPLSLVALDDLCPILPSVEAAAARHDGKPGA